MSSDLLTKAQTIAAFEAKVDSAAACKQAIMDLVESPEPGLPELMKAAHFTPERIRTVYEKVLDLHRRFTTAMMEVLETLEGVRRFLGPGELRAALVRVFPNDDVIAATCRLIVDMITTCPDPRTDAFLAARGFTDLGQLDLAALGALLGILCVPAEERASH